MFSFQYCEYDKIAAVFFRVPSRLVFVGRSNPLSDSCVDVLYMYVVQYRVDEGAKT